jgi:hypothetical protein
VIRRKLLRAERAVDAAGLGRGGSSEGKGNDDNGELHFDWFGGWVKIWKSKKVKDVMVDSLGVRGSAESSWKECD